MFLRVSTEHISQFQDTVLVLNTVLLLVALIIFEIVYSASPKEDKKHLKIFYPYIALFALILLYTVYTRAGKL